MAAVSKKISRFVLNNDRGRCAGSVVIYRGCGTRGQFCDQSLNTTAISGCFELLTLTVVIDLECGYIGCYGDNDGNRDLNDVISDDEQASDVDDAAATDVMTVDACIEQCRANGSPYAGLQAGSTCHCGQTYGRYGPSTSKNMPSA